MCANWRFYTAMRRRRRWRLWRCGISGPMVGLAFMIPRRNGMVGVITTQRSGPSIVPVAHCSAREIAWHRWQQTAVAVCGVVSASAIVPIFHVATYRHYRGTATYTAGCVNPCFPPIAIRHTQCPACTLTDLSNWILIFPPIQ